MVSNDTPVNLADWLSYVELLHSVEIEFGLDRVRKVFDRLFPDNLTSRVITVGGTNGKGSTCSVIEQALLNGGYSCGKNTSPHLERFNERIVVNGVNAKDSLIVNAFQQVELARIGRIDSSTSLEPSGHKVQTIRHEIALTYFEFTFLAALWIFEEQKLDFMICEVGLGGRLDAVNILSPEVSVITNIGLDHTQWLGDNRDAIAMEKVAISRAGRPCIVGDEDFPQSATNYLHKLKSNYLIANTDFRYSVSETSWQLEVDSFASRFPQHSVQIIKNLPKLDATHQYQNASCAILALLSLPELRVSRQSLQKALLTSNVQGRCQIISQSPMVVVDVAHNVDSVKALNQFIEVKKIQLNYAPKVCAVFSMLDDKDISACVNEIHHQIDEWFIAPLETDRAATVDRIKSTIRSINDDCSIYTFDSLEPAYKEAKKHCEDKDFILVFGSFYVVGDILRSHREGHI